MPNPARDSGMVSFKVLFILLILFIIIHIGVKVTPLYIDAEAMKDEMSAMARFAQTTKDEEILSDLVKKAKDLDLPLGPEDFKLLRDDASRRMKIGTAWDVELHFFFDIYPPYTARTFHFTPIVEEDYARKF
ncbi:MAG: hypothetical protein M0R70_09535 [Nitrospirae bacterium]|nr:hypothetical protein [Nitrospirota bacterium]